MGRRAGIYSFAMTVPGGDDLPVAGVTMVGVAPTHRRQGVLTSLMERQLHDVADEAIAVLTASETTIYGRFGYGWATDAARVELETARSAFRTEPEAGGSRQLRVGDAHGPISEVYERCRRLRPGTLSRSDAYHELMLRDRARWRDGASAMYVVVHDDAQGRPDGYATYRVAEQWQRSLPDHRGERHLRHRPRGRGHPVALPARHRPGGPGPGQRAPHRRPAAGVAARAVACASTTSPTTCGCGCSTRPPPRCLYAVEGLAGHRGDRRLPARRRCTFRLEGGPDGAQCARTDDPPDLTMAADDLGALDLVASPPPWPCAALRSSATRAVAQATSCSVPPPPPFQRHHVLSGVRATERMPLARSAFLLGQRFDGGSCILPRLTWWTRHG